METGQTNHEALREQLRKRIESGEQLRRELADFFNESARAVLIPAAEDIRAAGASAVERLSGWKSSIDETLAHLEEGNRGSVARFGSQLQHEWHVLQNDLKLRLDGIVGDLNREVLAWTDRYRAAADVLDHHLAGLAPAAHELNEAASSVRGTAADLGREVGDTLRQLSAHSRGEIEKDASEARERLRALFEEFVQQNGAAYERFRRSSDELLTLQREQIEGTSIGLADLRRAVADFGSGTSEELLRISTSLEAGFNRSFGGLKASLEEARLRADTNAGLTRQSFESGIASVTGLVRDTEAKAATNSSLLLATLNSGISALEAKISHSVVSESKAIQARMDGPFAAILKSSEQLSAKLSEIESAATAREAAATRQRLRWFLLLAVLIVISITLTLVRC